MLRRRVAVALTLPVFLTVVVVACSSDPADQATNLEPATGPDARADTGETPGTDGGPTPHEDASTLPDSGVIPPPDATAVGDPCRGQPLPEDQHFVTQGLCARLVAAPTSGLRQLMFTSKGDMFGQSVNGKIYLFRDEDDDGFFAKSEIHLWADSGSTGNNAHVDEAGGFVYAGFDTGIKRFAWDPNTLLGGSPETVVNNVPNGGGHVRHTVHVYDGYLYVHSGSEGNLTHESGSGQQAYDTKRALIKRFKLADFTGTAFEWSAGEVVTVGLRNANGFKRNEVSKKIYGVVNGADDLEYPNGTDVHNDNPGEQVLEIAANKQYGYPFCFTAQRLGSVVAGTQLANPHYESNPHDDDWCGANSDKPSTFVQAHSAPLDIVFFDAQPKGNLPERWRGGAFVAMHGSWNRSPATGYKVVWVPFNADGTAPMPTSTSSTTTFTYETVFGGGTVAGGPVDKAWAWSADSSGETVRPAGVAMNPIDGSLYIASDEGGLVYRVGIKQ